MVDGFRVREEIMLAEGDSKAAVLFEEYAKETIKRKEEAHRKATGH